MFHRDKGGQEPGPEINISVEANQVSWYKKCQKAACPNHVGVTTEANQVSCYKKCQKAACSNHVGVTIEANQISWI